MVPRRKKPERSLDEREPPSDGGERSAPADEKRRDVPQKSSEQPRPYPDLVDDTLDDSFPASDPPSWAGS